MEGIFEAILQFLVEIVFETIAELIGRVVEETISHTNYLGSQNNLSNKISSSKEIISLNISNYK